VVGRLFQRPMQYAFLFRGCALRSYPRLLSEDRVAVSLVVSLRIIIKKIIRKEVLRTLKGYG